jgi:exonuclease V gamma subunit
MAGLMDKIPARKYPKRGILCESASMAKVYEIKMLQKLGKNCNIYLRIKSYNIFKEGEGCSSCN